MVLFRVACTIFAYYAALSFLQGCNGEGDIAGETMIPLEETTSAPTVTKETTPAPAPTKVVSGELSFTMSAEAATSVVEAFSNPETQAEVEGAFAKSRRAAGRAELLAKGQHTDRLQNPAKLRGSGKGAG